MQCRVFPVTAGVKKGRLPYLGRRVSPPHKKNSKILKINKNILGQTFSTQSLPGPNCFKPSVRGDLRVFRAFASLFTKEQTKSHQIAIKEWVRGLQTEGCTSLPPAVEQFQLAVEQFQLELVPEGIVERSL